MEAAEEPVRIRTAADLWSVLGTGPMEARTAVLQSVVEQPDRPLSLGTHQGKDFVDLLLALVPLCSGGFRQLHILCLMCYQDERTSRFFVEEFSRSQDATVVIMLGKRLAVEKGIDFFKPFLWSDSSARSLAAARICASEESLDPAERFRIAILLDEFTPPPIEPESLDLWTSSLRSRYRLRVRHLARSRGQEALHLWSRWEELPAEEQEWLMALTAELNPELLVRRVSDCLDKGPVSAHLIRRALDCQIELSESLLSHGDPSVRAAAISQGLADGELEKYLSPQATAPEAVAAAARCDRRRLLELLSDERWQVRARATDLLVGKGESSIPPLRELASSQGTATRVAAVAALQRLGDEDWLRDRFCEQTG